ncbi:MAG: hypothetical protein INR71_13365, partial [Terriglobus roseus]|nr:hypothetical protein [Terriglobus roseus]
MHLLASYRTGALASLPTSLPAGLIEAASRRPTQAQAIPRQFSGQQGAGRTGSPLARQAFGPPQPQPAQPSDWVIGPAEKSGFDTLFTRLDTLNAGSITGAQAVEFFSQSELPQESLAAIWDLATIRGQDQLNRDEFAVAMYLIRDQRGKAKPDLPARLPQNLIPPSLRGQVKPSIAPQPGFAPPPAQPQKPPSAAEDLFGLDALSASPPAQQSQPGVQVQTQNTGGSVPGARGGGFDDPFSAKSASSPTAPNFGGSGSPRTATSHFKPFIPSSSFGQGLATQNTGGSAASSQQGPQSAGGFGASTRQAPASAMDDLLGDNDESSRKIGNDTSELANMSNQIGILRNQMADVTSKKQATEQDLAQTSSQKRDLEMRLSQFRTQYEAEARAVKELEEQLSAARKESRRIQQDLAVLEAGWQDLQAQHGNAARALEQERSQNAQLKARMQAVNGEVAVLRPQLEQMQREAKIERGRVSINRKEVERSEATRDGVKAEMDQLRSEAVEARSAPQAVAREEVASPALSTTSASGGKGNPFFRKSPQPSFDAGSNMSPSAFG